MGLLSPVSHLEAFYLKVLSPEALRSLGFVSTPWAFLLSVSFSLPPHFAVAISIVCEGPKKHSVLIPGCFCGNTSIEEDLSL